MPVSAVSRTAVPRRAARPAQRGMRGSLLRSPAFNERGPRGRCVPADRSGAAQVPGDCQFLTIGGSSTIGDQNVDRTKTRCCSHPNAATVDERNDVAPFGATQQRPPAAVSAEPDYSLGAAGVLGESTPARPSNGRSLRLSSPRRVLTVPGPAPPIRSCCTGGRGRGSWRADGRAPSHQR